MNDGYVKTKMGPVKEYLYFQKVFLTLRLSLLVLLWIIDIDYPTSI